MLGGGKKRTIQECKRSNDDLASPPSLEDTELELFEGNVRKDRRCWNRGLFQTFHPRISKTGGIYQVEPKNRLQGTPRR